MSNDFSFLKSSLPSFLWSSTTAYSSRYFRTRNSVRTYATQPSMRRFTDSSVRGKSTSCKDTSLQCMHLDPQSEFIINGTPASSGIRFRPGKVSAGRVIQTFRRSPVSSGRLNGDFLIQYFFIPYLYGLSGVGITQRLCGGLQIRIRGFDSLSRPPFFLFRLRRSAFPQSCGYCMES